MKSKQKPADRASSQQRREFIKKSAIVGAGVAAGSMTTTSAIADVQPASPDKPEQKGYQLTPHVLDYYKSADI